MSEEGVNTQEQPNSQNAANVEQAQPQQQVNSQNTTENQTVDKKEQAKQAKLQKKEEAKQKKLQKEQEKQAKKAQKGEKKAGDAAAPEMSDEEKLKRTDAVNEFFKTPPAGVYPKTDSQGRVIKYKKRGGVFAFFVGIFFSLFLFVFCGGLVASYFYYCYNIEDAGKTLGVDTSFLPQDTKNKTANQIVSILMEYKDGYVNMTVGDAKEKLGLDVGELVEKNLGIKVENFNEMEITSSKINGGNPIKVKDVRLQDIINNMQPFINALLPELYKKVQLTSLLDLANVKINLDKPLTQDAIFDLTPNPSFTLFGNSYTINYAKKSVECSALNTTYELKNGKFTIADVEYTISDDRTKITFDGGNISLTYNHTYKKLDEISVDDLLNSIIPNYIGGESLTVDFLEKALNIEIVDRDDPDYAGLLNTSITNLKVDRLLNSVSLRSFEKLFGLKLIPLDDERYDAILDEKIGELTAGSVTEKVSMGAFLDLLKVEMPDLPFLSYDDFKNTKMKNIKDYVYSLTVNDFLNNIIEEVHPYSYFVKDDINYYINTKDSKILTKQKTQIAPIVDFDFSKIDDKDVLPYFINGKTYLLYDNYLYKHNGETIDSTTKEVTIHDEIYVYDKANNKLTKKGTTQEIPLNANKQFFISNDSRIVAFGTVDSDTQITYYNMKDESKVTGRIFRLNFSSTDPGFMEDTTITFKLDKDNNIEYLKDVATIDTNNKFTLNSTEYTIGDTEVTTLSESYEIKAKSTTLQIALYAVSDLSIKNVVDGDFKGLVSDDAKLSNLLLTDVINKEFTGMLKNLNGLTIGEIVDAPDILIDRIKVITLGEIMGIDDSSSPLLKAILDAELTIGDLLEEQAPGEENPIIKAMGKVTFFDLGVKNSPNYLFNSENEVTIGGTTYTYDEMANTLSDGTNTFPIVGTKNEVTIDSVVYRFKDDAIGKRLTPSSGFNPLMSILETVKISDVLEDDGLYNIIKNITLSEITESNTGVMSILGDIKFEDFGQEDVITNALKASYKNLSELLDQKIYFYDHFEIDDEMFYIVDDQASLVNGFYTVSNTYDIRFNLDQNFTPNVLREYFTYNSVEYQLNYQTNKVQQGSTNVANIVNKKFVLDNKLFIDSGSKIYELTKSTSTIVVSGNKVTEFDGNAVDVDIVQSSSLNNALLSIRVSELFGGDFSDTLTSEIQNIKLIEVLGASPSNELLNALVTKNPNVTINTLGDDISNLTMGEVFGASKFNSGILKVMNVKDTKLLDVVDEINNFDISTQTMETLITNDVVDFGSTINGEILGDSTLKNKTLIQFVTDLYNAVYH